MLWFMNTGFLQNRQGGAPGTAALHWHAHAVSSLAFSMDGTNLISGGHEAVLVTWQLGTRNKSFLPRLGGTIETISVSPLGGEVEPTYAVSLDDNTIRLASAVSGQVRHCLCRVFPLHLWLRHCLCLVFPLGHPHAAGHLDPGQGGRRWVREEEEQEEQEETARHDLCVRPAPPAGDHVRPAWDAPVLRPRDRPAHFGGGGGAV